MALAKEEFGQRFRAARERAHLTQQELADRLGLDWRQVQRYDTGAAIPRATRIPEIAKAIGVEPSYFEESLAKPIYERLEEQARENAVALRTALALLDGLTTQARAIQASVERLQTETAGRYDVLTARLDATETALTQVQRDFLQALGAPAPPPAADAPGQAKGTRSKKNPGTGREAG